MGAPPTGRLARGAVSGMALAHAGVARVGRQARKLTRSAAEQEASQSEYEAEIGRILFRALNQLKGTALKLSQLLSAHAGFLPEGVRNELARGCYQVTPLNRALVHKVFRSEFGRAPEQLFSQFDSAAFAAASLGQVHHAQLGDGARVAVKVQYPGIAASVTSDLRMLRTMVLALGGGMLPSRALVEQVLDDAGAKLAEELDYVHEAQQLLWFRARVRMDGIVIPAPIGSHSTRRVLTMEHLEGQHLDQWLASNPSQEERDRFGQLLFDWFFYSLFELGRLHADPHPGNFLFMPDGRLGVIDFGCTRTVAEGFGASMARAWNAALDLPAPGAQAALRLAYVDLQLIAATLAQEEFDQHLMPVLAPIVSWQVEPFRGARCDFALRCEVPTTTAGTARQFAAFTTGMHPDLPYFDRAYVGIMHLLRTLGANVATANRWINEEKKQ